MFITSSIRPVFKDISITSIFDKVEKEEQEE